MNDGGLLAFDLSGTVRQTILPTGFGEIRYNNVDLLYDFELGGQLVDLAVVSDGANDTLAVYRIDPTSPALIDVTSQAMPSTIFGIDNGVATASELAAYTDRLTGTASAFVSQADGNLVAQLRLTDDGAGGVVAEVVRTLTLPDSPAKGMVVDREFGFLYVGLAAGAGIFKFRAEPTGGDDPEPVRVIANYPLLPAVEALTIYYGPTGDGYLLVSSPGDSPYAVFERSGDNDYLGRFAVGDTAEIDQANESAGVAVLNAALGDTFAHGLLVVQDQVNDPQFVAENGVSLENRSTNFKFLPWENVANLFPEPLIIAPNGHDPRAR
jgi:myo-inositol-hexaphosphate 3-phosphohydrolase